jgi:hypothetical protein
MSGRQESDDCINSSLFLTLPSVGMRVSCAARVACSNFFQLSERMKKNGFFLNGGMAIAEL